MKRESKGGGYLDFSYSAIPHEFAGASRNPLRNESPMLFIPEGDSYAHNHMNFGIFYGVQQVILWALVNGL